MHCSGGPPQLCRVGQNDCPTTTSPLLAVQDEICCFLVGRSYSEHYDKPFSKRTCFIPSKVRAGAREASFASPRVHSAINSSEFILGSTTMFVFYINPTHSPVKELLAWRLMLPGLCPLLAISKLTGYCSFERNNISAPSRIP